MLATNLLRGQFLFEHINYSLKTTLAQGDPHAVETMEFEQRNNTSAAIGIDESTRKCRHVGRARLGTLPFLMLPKA